MLTVLTSGKCAFPVSEPHCNFLRTELLLTANTRAKHWTPHNMVCPVLTAFSQPTFNTRRQHVSNKKQIYLFTSSFIKMASLKPPDGKENLHLNAAAVASHAVSAEGWHDTGNTSLWLPPSFSSSRCHFAADQPRPAGVSLVHHR